MQTCSTETARRAGQMGLPTKDPIQRGLRTDLALSIGLMGLYTKATSKTTRSRVRVPTTGLMEGPTQAPGWQTRCMERAASSGAMVGTTKENMLKIKSGVLALSAGQTAGCTRACGKAESSMGKVHSLDLKVQNVGSGFMGIESAGLMNEKAIHSRKTYLNHLNLQIIG